MKFSYNWLQSFFEKRLPSPQKLADFLMMHSFEIEEVLKKGNDSVIDIDILPNRVPDCSSHFGIAREISAILGYKIKEKKYSFQEDRNIKIVNSVKVKVEDKHLCPRYCARVVKEIKVASSPKWLKERLEACGIQSINNIVDATNYIMLETGQPLHAFDAEKIDGHIIVRRAKNGEKITTLDDKKYILNNEVLVIADKKQPIALAGIKGGKKAEISKDTKIIVIESANFERTGIYKTSKKLKLQTDASLRFSSGIDPNLAERAINEVVSLIQQLAGGKITKGIVDFYPRKAESIIIKLRYNYLKSLIGVEIPKNKVLEILKSLGFKIQNSNSETLNVVIPTFRRDLSIEEDLIEEVGRIYGYEQLPSKLSILQTSFPQRNRELDLIKKIRTSMKELGFTETYNYSFISEEDAEFFSKQSKENLYLIELLNPVSSNIKYLRFSLIPNLLKVIKLNQKRFENIKIFEIGKIFTNQKEKRVFGGLIVGKDKFFELKGLIHCLFAEIGVPDEKYLISRQTSKLWKKNCLAEMTVKKERLGILGEISSETLDFYEIKKPVFAFEIDFQKLLKLSTDKKQYKPIPVYPETIRDLSVITPVETLAEDIIKQIYSSGKNLIIKVEIFDVYEGSPLQRGEKNLSFHIIYQAKDRTLTSKEVDKIQEKIIKNLEKNSQWKVRK